MAQNELILDYYSVPLAGRFALGNKFLVQIAKNNLQDEHNTIIFTKELTTSVLTDPYKLYVPLDEGNYEIFVTDQKTQAVARLSFSIDPKNPKRIKLGMDFSGNITLSQK